jgi:hypothetical protein
MWPRIVHFCDGKKDICFREMTEKYPTKVLIALKIKEM